MPTLTYDLDVPAYALVPGDMVEMEALYEHFDETDRAEYLVAQSELGEVENVESTTDGGVIIGFSNFETWKLPANHVCVVTRHNKEN